MAQHPELTRALEKPAGESFLAGYSTSLRHESRTSEFPSASKQPSYMMDGMTDRPTKISFGEMRDSSVRGLLVYCADYAAATRPRSAVMAGLSDIEPSFIRGARV